MNDLKGKKILLLYARFFGYDDIVKRKLEELGAFVDLYDARANINSFEKAIKKVNIKFYKNKQKKFHFAIIDKNKSKNYDLIFSNENLSNEILDKYHLAFPKAKLILYMDDSVANSNGIEKTFTHYDKILTFDRNDSQKYKLIFRPLFYCDFFSMMQKNIYDFSFVGTCHSDRLKILDSIEDQFKDKTFYFYKYLPGRFMFFYYKLKDKQFKKKKYSDFEYKALSLNEVASKMTESRIIVDIQHPKQSGLTMRTIETLGSMKKLITTNQDIMNYDFYNSHNILIIDRNNPVIDTTFLEQEYVTLDKSIYEKYTLKQWVLDVFVGEVYE